MPVCEPMKDSQWIANGKTGRRNESTGIAVRASAADVAESSESDTPVGGNGWQE